MTQRLAFALPGRPGGGAAGRTAAPAAPGADRRQPPISRRDLPRRSQLRRGRRASSPTRRATPSPTSRRTTSRSSRTASRRSVATFSLVNIPIERAERPLFAVSADRGRRADQRSRRGTHLPDRARRSPHRLHAYAAREGGGPRFIEQNFGTNDMAAVVFTGRARGRSGLHEQPRGCSSTPSTSSLGASCSRRTLNTYRGCPASIPAPGPSSPATTSTDGSRLPARACHGQLDPQARRSSWPACAAAGRRCF